MNGRDFPLSTTEVSVGVFLEPVSRSRFALCTYQPWANLIQSLWILLLQSENYCSPRCLSKYLPSVLSLQVNQQIIAALETSPPNLPYSLSWHSDHSHLPLILSLSASSPNLLHPVSNPLLFFTFYSWSHCSEMLS